MTLREKRLAAAVAVAGALWAGTTGMKRYRDAVERNEGVAVKAADELADAEFALARGEKARHNLHEWRLRSLPTDRAVAKSLYQDWVRAQVTAAGLTVEQLVDKTLSRREDHFEELSLEVRAAGTMEQLANFLYTFYAAPHLHRIAGATLTPSEAGAKLTAVLNIDALILADCPRADKLAEGHEQELLQSQEEFRTSLVSRNIFTAHTPGASAAADLAKARFSGTTSDAEDLLMVITMEGAKTLRFRRGDTITVGKFTGTLVELDGRRAVIETPDGRVEVKLGQNLGEAKKVEESEPETGDESEDGEESDADDESTSETDEEPEDGEEPESEDESASETEEESEDEAEPRSEDEPDSESES
jgi:hypothetical protein